MGLMNPVGPIGPAGLSNRGAWQSTGVTYNYRDAARRPNATTPNAGGYFLCLANGITSDPLIDTTNWLLIAADGATGPAGGLSIGLDGTHAAAGNDVRLRNPDPPGLHGWIATTIRDREASSTTRPGTGTAIFARIYLPSPATITNVICQIGATGSNNQTGFYMGLYDSSGNQLAVSAESHTILNTATAVGNLVVVPLSSAYSWAGGSGAFLYAAYLAIGGTTLPALTASTTNTQSVDANMSTRQWAGMQIASQATLPSPTWGTTGTQLTVTPWFGVS